MKTMSPPAASRVTFCEHEELTWTNAVPSHLSSTPSGPHWLPASMFCTRSVTNDLSGLMFSVRMGRLLSPTRCIPIARTRSARSCNEFWPSHLISETLTSLQETCAENKHAHFWTWCCTCHSRERPWCQWLWWLHPQRDSTWRRWTWRWLLCRLFHCNWCRWRNLGCNFSFHPQQMSGGLPTATHLQRAWRDHAFVIQAVRHVWEYCVSLGMLTMRCLCPQVATVLTVHVCLVCHFALFLWWPDCYTTEQQGQQLRSTNLPREGLPSWTHPQSRTTLVGSPSWLCPYSRCLHALCPDECLGTCLPLLWTCRAGSDAASSCGPTACCQSAGQSGQLLWFRCDCSCGWCGNVTLLLPLLHWSKFQFWPTENSPLWNGSENCQCPQLLRHKRKVLHHDWWPCCCCHDSSECLRWVSSAAVQLLPVASADKAKIVWIHQELQELPRTVGPEPDRLCGCFSLEPLLKWQRLSLTWICSVLQRTNLTPRADAKKRNTQQLPHPYVSFKL